MLAKSLIRAHVAAKYPNLDKYALSGITNKIHEWAYSEDDLKPHAIEGAVLAYLRHNRTSYEQDLRAHASQYFGSARKHFQEIAHKTLQLKYGI